jgi:hypothetical protein
MATTLSWQKLPADAAQDPWIIWAEGAEIYLYIGDNPVTASAFKLPPGVALERMATVQNIWIRGVDTTTVVYYVV